MRTLSSAALEAIYAQDTGVAMLPLITIEHADIETSRLVANRANVTSRGNVFTACPFQMTIPNSIEGEQARVSLVIDNIDLSLMEAVRTLTGQPTITLEFILSSDYDTVEAGPFVFSLTNVDYNQYQIVGQAGHEPFLTEPFNDNKFTPIDFPGLFTSVR